MLRNVFPEEEEEYWQEAVAAFPNRCPRFETKQEAVAFIKRCGRPPVDRALTPPLTLCVSVHRYCTIGSNPDNQQLQHSVTTLTCWSQVRPETAARPPAPPAPPTPRVIYLHTPPPIPRCPNTCCRRSTSTTCASTASGRARTRCRATASCRRPRAGASTTTCCRGCGCPSTGRSRRTPRSTRSATSLTT